MAASAQSPWIRSAGYDLVFFSTLWMAPLLLFAFYGLIGLGVSAVAIALLYHAVLRLPHFVATLQVTYASQSNRAYYRQHWIRYFVVPALILVVCALPGLLGHAVTPWFRTIVVTIASVWGIQHIGRQNFGILSLYRRRAQLPPDPEGVELEKRILDVLIIAGAASTLAVLFPAGEPLRVFLDVAHLCLYFAAACFVGYYFFRVLRSRKQPLTTWPAALYFLTSLAVMVRWPFYDRLPTPDLRTGMFFFVFNGHHCLAYLGLLFMMDCNKRETNRPVFVGWREGARQFAMYLAPLAAGSTLLLWLTTGAFTLHGMNQLFTEKTLGHALGLLNGTFVVHYYLEAMAWRFSNPHHRQTVLPLLRQPRLAPEVAAVPATPGLQTTP